MIADPRLAECPQVVERVLERERRLKLKRGGVGPCLPGEREILATLVVERPEHGAGSAPAGRKAKREVEVLVRHDVALLLAHLEAEARTLAERGTELELGVDEPLPGGETSLGRTDPLPAGH